MENQQTEYTKLVDRKLLKEHIKESNAIENIFIPENHHLFLDHMAAAEFVLRSVLEFKIIATPQSIHGVLMKHELPEAGKFRKVRVWVGSDLKPQPENVAKLMKKWEESLQKDLRSGCCLTLNQKEKLAWHYHDWFEAIHPFVDGNGRVGRLILNNIRLLLGLTWLIILFSERWQYYKNIQKWEMKHKTTIIQ